MNLKSGVKFQVTLKWNCTKQDLLALLNHLVWRGQRKLLILSHSCQCIWAKRRFKCFWTWHVPYLCIKRIFKPANAHWYNMPCQNINYLHVSVALIRYNTLPNCISNKLNTFTAIVDLSRFNNSWLKSPASTLVHLTFQSRALRSFSLNQLRNLSL